MKTKALSIGLSLIGIVAIAQKKEIRKAAKAVESGNYTEAKTLLTSVEGAISNEKDRIQADFYLTKGNAFLAAKKETTLKTEDLITAGESFQKAIVLGEEEEGKIGIAEVKRVLITAASEDQTQEKFKESSKKIYTAYTLSNKDTLYLYYAAYDASRAEDFDNALNYFKKLRDVGYTGKGTIYTAVNKETGEVEEFGNDKNKRDIYIKAGSHIKPSSIKEESKRPDIVKNIALIYLQKDEKEKAIKAIQQARKESPEDTNLMLTEADIYYNLGKMDKYSQLVEKVIEIDPGNATLYYNLGVTASKMGDPEKAIGYYKKAIKIDPEMLNANINIASAILNKEKGIIEEMNGLGMSNADNKRYKELQEERNSLYTEATPYLEKVIQNKPKESAEYKQSAQILSQIYSMLGETEKAKALKE
ncbi:tetratricopeptide repeat protein [Mesonia sp. MT50]|uniref:Tetratricopeptide repeat protein n=1 Tax=Mesonia profundi TaxID=3070998 RepID=A0ABU1A4N4_9FLAO|nr:tetratricopeptide repeat protein [Mesonia profundi]MDQ7917666.1 tetratricopeptide repeat protein [Mesonia profundi]